MDPDGVVALLAEIVRGALSLPEAACVDQYRLYDEIRGRGHQHHDQEHARIARAATCCVTCRPREVPHDGHHHLDRCPRGVSRKASTAD